MEKTPSCESSNLAIKTTTIIELRNGKKPQLVKV
jgi:hypothetical protein